MKKYTKEEIIDMILFETADEAKRILENIFTNDRIEVIILDDDGTTSVYINDELYLTIGIS